MRFKTQEYHYSTINRVIRQALSWTSSESWPSTRASLLVRLRDPRDEAAWTEFVDLAGLA